MLALVLRLAVVVLVSLGLALPTLAASGQALGVDPDAAAETKGASRTLVVGADIFIGDRIVTDTKGLVQILFSDNTRLVVGPKSSLVIDDYLLRENGSNGKLAINALNGTFRFITGKAAKDRYVIKTPTGTIGVRGTAFDFYIGDSSNGSPTYILQLHGSTEDCPNETPDDCAILESVCQMGILDSSEFQVIKHTDQLTGAERDQAKEIFKLAFSQGDLLRQFRVQGAERCLKRPASIDDPGKSMSEPGSGETPGKPKPGGGGGCSFSSYHSGGC